MNRVPHPVRSIIGRVVELISVTTRQSAVSGAAHDSYITTTTTIFSAHRIERSAGIKAYFERAKVSVWPIRARGVHLSSGTFCCRGLDDDHSCTPLTFVEFYIATNVKSSRHQRWKNRLYPQLSALLDYWYTSYITGALLYVQPRGSRSEKYLNGMYMK